MTRPMNLQDMFLNQARKEHIPVTIYLTNGFQFRGQVKGFDSYVVVLECDGKQNLVYKHAISTITPFKAIFIPEGEKANPEQEPSAPCAVPDTVSAPDHER